MVASQTKEPAPHTMTRQTTEAERKLNVLEHIELEHIDEEGREDIDRAAALGLDTDRGAGYFLNYRLFGSLCSISLAAIAAFWGFSPPAAILTFIAEDIGKRAILSRPGGRANKIQEPAEEMRASSPSSGPCVRPLPFCCLVGCLINLVVDLLSSELAQWPSLVLLLQLLQRA